LNSLLLLTFDKRNAGHEFNLNCINMYTYTTHVYINEYYYTTRLWNGIYLYVYVVY